MAAEQPVPNHPFTEDTMEELPDVPKDDLNPIEVSDPLAPPSESGARTVQRKGDDEAMADTVRPDEVAQVPDSSVVDTMQQPERSGLLGRQMPDRAKPQDAVVQDPDAVEVNMNTEPQVEEGPRTQVITDQPAHPHEEHAWRDRRTAPTQFHPDVPMHPDDRINTESKEDEPQSPLPRFDLPGEFDGDPNAPPVQVIAELSGKEMQRKARHTEKIRNAMNLPPYGPSVLEPDEESVQPTISDVRPKTGSDEEDRAA
ncbi:hypothetical protein GF380_02255 [Candidatus Uhrbacteria bacterium]|nr:hypothetical protein [Candidatus Uhrbacteria bacterium]MBD3284039.1 hypothetical protein [Candidatus Uhrbacteria bacterium]